MIKKHWRLAALLAVPLVVSGLAYGGTLVKAEAAQPSAGYVCPLTGETLPCPDCCPMEQES